MTLKKGDKRYLHIAATLTEDEHEGEYEYVHVVIRRPGTWNDDQKVVVYPSDLIGGDQRNIWGCADCVREDLRRLSESKQVKEMTITVKLRPKKRCDCSSDKLED